MPGRTIAAENAALVMDDALSIFNPFPKLLDGPRLLHQLIFGSDGNDRVALEYLTADGESIRLTYSELHSQAERLASRLLQSQRQSSQGRAAIIPVLMPQSPALYISILAILKSGAAFCPLNLDVPEERLKFILSDTSAQIILTTSELQSKLAGLQDISVITVDNGHPESHTTGSNIDSSSPSDWKGSIESEHPLAYIMYTSGSTGLPKAVCLSHLAVTQSLLAHDRHIPSFSRFLQFASPTFDVSVFEIFFPWYRGSTLVACDRDRLLGDLPGTITALNIDAAELTPSVAASLVRKREKVPTLRTLLTIGEMLNVQVIKEFGGSASKPSILYGMYGPTEAAIHCTLQPSFTSDLPAGTIGFPLDTVSCIIARPAESPDRASEIEILPLGEVGELVVGGHQLADGYLNREEQTRATFVTHPKYGNLYRTGDKARLLRDGRLECQGRISSGQVKLRGQRVELGEIEHAAAKVSGCHAAVASVISGILIVFCIVESKSVTLADIKSACRQWLPNYMVPSDVVLLDDFPYLPSGKVDKKKLESDYHTRLSDSPSENRLVSDETRKLIGVFEDILQVSVSPSTELGSAGLDSLKAIQLASQLNRQGYSGIGALDLLAAQTLQDIEAFMLSIKSSGDDVLTNNSTQEHIFDVLKASVLAEPEMERYANKVVEVVPCTPLQDAMLLETARNSQAYCNSFELAVTSGVSMSQLRNCFKILAERHVLLRSGFYASGSATSSFVQVVWKELDNSQILLVDDFDRNFMICDSSMLLRPLHFQCKENADRTEVLVQIHHALYDQWSVEILLEDIDTLLREAECPARPAFRSVNEHFARLKALPEGQTASLAFWQDYLSAATPGRLPSLNGENKSAISLANTECMMHIDMTALHIYAQQQRCSLHVVFQSAYAYLLSLYMGSDDVTFGTVFSGRTLPIPDIENIVGPLLSTLPTRLNFSEARKFTDIIRRAQGDNRNIMQHSSTSLADVRKVCGISPGEALFDSIFVWQETARKTTTGARLVELVTSRDYLEFNLTLELEPADAGVKAKATFQPAVLPDVQIKLMLRQLEELVKHVIRDPECLVQDMTEPLPASLLSIANPCPKSFTYEAGLGAVLKRHVADSPEMPALCFASDIGENKITTDILTYKELDARANRLSHHLIALGTLPNELICVCMEKSVDLYVSILATVKAGAGYLPLVPETPSSRIQQILSDATVKLCLTDSTTSGIINDLHICQAVEVSTTDVSKYPATSPNVRFQPSDIAYAVFTSGTTGQPKGVLVTQENILIAALVKPVNVPNVHFLVTAGEAVTNQVHDAWAGKGLYQGYGPSETTNICTVNPAVASAHAINNIGPGFENTSTFVLANSTDFKIIPTGGLGELCFGGQQVFRGYQNMPDLTRSKIIDHPKYGRIYRSGDLGRLLPNGSILVEGRIDDQRKLRGQRIELGEIATCLLRSPEVRDCTVQIIGETKQQERLVVFWIPSDTTPHAYSVLNSGKSRRKTIESLFDMLMEELPSYMIPSLLIPVAVFPMTPQEDLQSFTQMSEDDTSTDGLSHTEMVLVSSLAETLQVSCSSIKRTTSFFALGLDSVSAIKLSRSIKNSLGYQFDVSTILKRPSVARLAAIYEKESNVELFRGPAKRSPSTLVSDELRTAVSEDFASRGRTVASVLPCTPLQEAMLSASSASSGNSASAYRNRTLFKISGDIQKLRRSWETMLQRHGILRTALISTEDAKFPFVQVVLADFAVPWQEFNYIPDDVAKLLHSAEANDDEYAPPYSLKVFRSNITSYLVLDMHHAMYDGNAMSNLLAEVEQAYNGASLAAPATFDRFLEYMVSLDNDDADSFFDRQLANYIPKPFQKQASVGAESIFDVFKSELPFSQAAINIYLKRHSISFLGLVQAAWVKVLSVAQNHSDVCFGNVMSGRSVPVEGVESLVAPCFNTVPLRIDLAKHGSNISMIKFLQETNVEVMPFQIMALRKIQARSSVEGHRLFDSLVLLQHDAKKLNSKIWNLVAETGEMDFPCIVEITPMNESFNLSMHLDRTYFKDRAVGKRLCDAYLAAFASCIKYPSSEPSDLVDFGKAEIAGLLAPDPNHIQFAEAAMRKGPKNAFSKSPEDEKWSSLELKIRDAFSAISGAPSERILRDTTIYKIGLDSISAIQVASRLRKKGFDLRSGDIMESPSCSELASVIQSRTQTPVKNTPTFDLEAFDKQYRPAVVADTHVSSDNLDFVRPCTAIQSGMLSQYLHSNGEQYLNHTFYSLDEVSDMKQLYAAWSLVAHQHEMLRTGFISVDDKSHPFAMLTFKQIDIATARLDLKNEIIGFEEREQAASDAIQVNLHSPPWKWDLFRHNGRSCLQFSAHHALFDAETLRFITGDLRTALAYGKLPRREKIDSGLSLIISQASTDIDQQQAFWTRKLEGGSITRFPNMTSVKVSDKQVSAVHSIFETSRTHLESKCREAGISLQAVGQAAWAKLLAAYTGEPHVTFGVVLSGRTTPETTDCTLPCITTLPVLINTSASDEKLVQDLMAYNAAIQKYQFTPLTEIQRFAGTPNEALFDSLFAYQKPLSAEADDATWSIVHEKATVDYAVSVEMEALPDGRLGLRLTFDTAHIPTAQGRIILKQMENLMLSYILGESKSESSILSINPPKDIQLHSDARYLHELVEITANRLPDTVALEFVTGLQDTKISSKQWTYRELNEEGNRIAQLLVQRGVKPGGVVAASFDKCPEASFAFLGILKAGCAFCAIDPSAPTARKAFILQDSKASLLLTNSEIVSELRGKVQCAAVDTLNLCGPESSSKQPIDVQGLSPSSVSYVLYTSGTTGTPKGCEITHENAVQAMLAFQRIFAQRYDDNSRWLQFASYHFDVSIVEQFWSWSVGMRLVCAPRDLILEDLTGFIDTLQITHLDLTPSLGRLLDPSLVPSLHRGVFITGGEGMRQDMVDSWGEVGCLFNFYGPTECTIGVTVFPSVPIQGKPSNIGWQFDNVGSYILAPGSHQPVLRGAVGELCISGKLVGKGYLNRTELTDECFPYLEAFKERVYRTGDLVRLLHDGSIDFLGRKDNQVKLRGQRLEIDEIEAVIRKCPDIKDVVCLVTKHPKQQKDLLVSFIALSSNRKQVQEPQLCPYESTAGLITSARSSCEEYLPGYMVPTHFIPIQVIPLSVNNKVEEKQLRALYNNLPITKIQEYATQAQDRKPMDDKERAIARLLAGLLKLDTAEVQTGSNVFALGLSSISAIQFSRKLRTEGFENAHVATVLRNPTISKLAKAIATSSRQEAGEITLSKQTIAACRQRNIGKMTQLLNCQVEDIEAIAPCTPLQQGIISRSLNSDSLLYFNSFCYGMPDVDLKRLRVAFETAVKKTQILRTGFFETDDGHIQVVKHDTNAFWFEIEAVHESEIEKILADRKQKWRESNSSNLTRPFELILIRFPGECVLVIHMHHALYDGISYQSLIQNVVDLYHGHQSCDFGRSFIDVLPYGPLRPTQGAREFWLEHLAGVGPASMISFADERSDQDVLYSNTLDLLRKADNTRRSLGVTIQAVIQTAWTAVLRQYYQGAVGTVVSGRSIDLDGAENVIGPMFNTIPFYPRFSGNDSWQTLVRRCHDFNISALPYQHTPLRDITKWCKRSPSEPLFDSLFVFQGASERDTEASTLVPKIETGFEADYPLSFEVEETVDGKLRVTLAAKGTICTTDKAAELVDEFRQTLSSLFADPHLKIGDVLKKGFKPSQAASINEVTAVDLNGVLEFDWTPDALTLRKEIATLAAVDQSEVGEHTSIFEIGLDSVDAVKLSSRLKKKGLSVAVSAIMRSQTVSRILEALTKIGTKLPVAQGTNSLHQLEKKLMNHVELQSSKIDDMERILPASPMQEALISEMLQTSYQAYFNHDVLRVSDDIEIDRLEEAWQTVINTSSILRTGFLQIDEPNLDITFAQVIHKPCVFRFRRTTLSREDDIPEYLQQIREDAVSGPLTRPHLRLTLASISNKNFIILSIAHALYDGYSLSLLHQDVHSAYHNRFNARPSYEEVLQADLDSSNDEAITFWRSLLSGATKTHIDLKANVLEPVTHRDQIASCISTDDITAFCRQQGVTIQALCQTAWTFVLARYAKSVDVMFGVVLAGRDSQLAEEVMFPMMNTVITRSVIHGTRREMLRYMQDTIADVVNYQHFPLRRIQAACQKEVQPLGTSDTFFNTLFTFQKRPEDSDSGSNVIYESVTGASDVEYPVAVEAEIVGDQLVWRTASKSSAFTIEETRLMLLSLDRVFRDIISRSDEPSLTFDNEGIIVCGQEPFKRGADRVGAGINNATNLPYGSEDTEAWSPEESNIRQIVAKVTRTPEEELSKHASIQNWGVDSINTIKIASLLRSKNMRISVSEIMLAGTIARIALSISERSKDAKISPVRSADRVIPNLVARKGFHPNQFGFRPDDIEQLLPATSGQAYMLSTWQNSGGQIFYPQFEYSLTIATDVGVISRAWEQLVTRHSILRTVFAATDDSDVPFVQLVLRSPSSSFVDLDSVLDSRGDQEAQPFARLSAKKIKSGYQLLLKIHHALYDAVSLPLLLQDLEQHIQSKAANLSQQNFPDFIAQGIKEDVWDKRRNFWIQYTTGCNSMRLPTSSMLSPHRVEVFNPQVISVDDKTHSALRKQGLSIQTLFFAAYAKAYAKLVVQGKEAEGEDAIMGIYLANRSHLDDLSSLAAPTLNLVPVRIKSPNHVETTANAKQIQADLQAVGSAQNSSVGLWEIEQWTGVKVDNFVNFIKLPDTDGDEGHKAEGMIVDEIGSRLKTEKRSLIHKGDTTKFEQPKELAKNVVKNSFLRSLDVEATVVNGHLGIGVFGWEDMVGLDQANKLIEDIGSSLRGALRIV
ncbi:hypothetical protein MBLNU459_g1145t2 [Dothideomycetes sp. NU459]